MAIHALDQNRRAIDQKLPVLYANVAEADTQGQGFKKMTLAIT